MNPMWLSSPRPHRRSPDHEDRQQGEDTRHPQGRRHECQRRFRPHPGRHRALYHEDEQDLKIDKENLTATVEPGVVLQDLTIRLAKEGLFFPPDPQSFLGATLGGIIAENAGGPACVKYGVTKQYILGIEVVLPTGEIVNLGGRTLKNVVGYDLLHIFISSEGTLGVVTKAELKLRPVSPGRKTIMAVYDDVAVAGESVFRVLENGVIPGKIELLDNWIINGSKR